MIPESLNKAVIGETPFLALLDRVAMGEMAVFPDAVSKVETGGKEVELRYFLSRIAIGVVVVAAVFLYALNKAAIDVEVFQCLMSRVVPGEKQAGVS
jgi:hypothetical protein